MANRFSLLLYLSHACPNGNWLHFGLLLLLSSSLFTGCGKPSADSTPSGKAEQVSSALAESGPAAQEILQKMRSTYREAESYTDNGSIVFNAVVRSSGSEQATPFTRLSVAFQRPNRLHVTLKKNISSPQEESFEVVSDGTIVRSLASEISNQVHEAIAPLQLSTENFIPEPALRGAILENSLENSLPQLAMLLTKENEQTVFTGESQARLLSEASLDGKSYHRVELPSPAGNRVLWVSQENYALRRMELPIDNQREQINANDQYSKFGVWIDFQNVTINPEIQAGTFTLAKAEGARRVRRFIPPPPVAPPEYLGKPVRQFVFKSLVGEDITPKTLEGKVAVLDFWSTNCPPCRVQTPVLNAVYNHFEGEEDVSFLAVSTDSRALSNGVVQKTLASWGGQMPIARDPKSSGFHDLSVRQTPTLLLLDREGRLQVFQIGAHQRAEPLIEAIQQLVDGEDLAAVARRQHATYLAKYEQALDAAEIKDSIVEVELAKPEVSPRQLPKNLVLEQLWKSSPETIERPGQVLVVKEAQGDDFHLLVFDGGGAIVELDSVGKLVGRHELPEHDETKNGFLRSASDGEGGRWTLASGVGWQQVYVFDEQWNQVVSFPDEPHSGIGDVLFDDLTNSGTPVMYVGYWGGLGVQGGTLDGRRLWSNRRLDHVLQVGVGPTLAGGESTIWCTSTRGTLTQLSTSGKSMLERYVNGQALMHFASQPDHQNQCGLAVDKVGQYRAVGFDQSDTSQWEYPLPPGEYVEQVPRVLSVRLPNGDAGWLVIAANGSLHWLDLTGQLIDRFEYGEVLTGVATGTLKDQSLLFVSTTEQLTAWQVSPTPSAPPVKSLASETLQRESKSESSEDTGPAAQNSSDLEEPSQPDADDTGK